MPNYRGWEIFRRLGGGGQGEVFLVRSPAAGIERASARDTIRATVRIIGRGTYEQPDSVADALADAVAKYTLGEKTSAWGALKQFKLSTDRNDAARAVKRFENEVEALKTVEGDPAALRIIDYDLNEHWMITEYYERGSLSKYPELFKGDVLGSLQALRPVVAVLAKLHQRGIVHRDIKPQNILVGPDNRLVLGDFGIVFTGTDNRPTEILERVGTRDWMAPWAHTGARIDEVQQNFDVFPLGKVLWSMIAGRAILPFWYNTTDDVNTISQFCSQATQRCI